MKELTMKTVTEKDPNPKIKYFGRIQLKFTNHYVIQPVTQKHLSDFVLMFKLYKV